MSSDQPLVSLIIVAWNVAPYVGQALASALGQTLDRLEVIIIDNGSTDGTAEVIQASAHDPRLTIITSPVNLGLGEGRNRALAVARGTYVAFLDGDDWLAPQAMAHAAAVAEARHAELVVFGHTRWRSATRQVVKRPPRPLDRDGPDAERCAAIRGPLPVWVRMARRDLVQRLGFGFPEGAYEDIRWSLRLTLDAATLATLDEPLCFYRRRPGSILQSQGEYHFDALVQWQRLAEDLKARPLSPALRTAVADAMVQQTRNIFAFQRLPATAEYRYFQKASAILRSFESPHLSTAAGKALQASNYFSYRCLIFPWRFTTTLSRIFESRSR